MYTAPEKRLQTLTAIFKLQVHDKEQYDQMAHWPVSKRLSHLVSLFARDCLNDYSAKQVLDWAETRLLEHLNIRQDSTSKDRYTILFGDSASCLQAISGTGSHIQLVHVVLHHPAVGHNRATAAREELHASHSAI